EVELVVGAELLGGVSFGNGGVDLQAGVRAGELPGGGEDDGGGEVDTVGIGRAEIADVGRNDRRPQAAVKEGRLGAAGDQVLVAVVEPGDVPREIVMRLRAVAELHRQHVFGVEIGIRKSAEEDGPDGGERDV